MLKKGIVIISITIIFLLGLRNTYHLYEYFVTWKFECAGLQSHYLKTADTTLHYWTGGTGEPLVLIHGFGADSRFQWHKQVCKLSKQFALIIPDLVYFNSSTSFSNKYSLDFQAETVMALLQYLRISRFSVAGISYGGMVAITISDNIPDRIDRMILCGSPIRYDRTDKSKPLLSKYNIRSVEDLLMPQRPEDIPRLLKLTYYDPPWIPGIALKGIHDHMFKNQSPEKIKLLKYRYDNNGSLSRKEYSVKCRVLLVWGRYDELVPPEVGIKLNKYLGDRAELVLIDQSGHAPNLERPDEFYRVMADFLNQ